METRHLVVCWLGQTYQNSRLPGDILPKQIDLILKLTNQNLEESGKKLVTKSLMLCFLGINVLLTCCAVQNQRRLWDEIGEVDIPSLS